MTQRFARLHLINASRNELAFQSHKFSLLACGHLHIILRENCDHVSWLQDDVLALVTSNGFAQVKRHQMSAEVLRVHSLDDRVFPVNFSSGTLYFILQLFLLDALRFCPANPRGQVLIALLLRALIGLCTLILSCRSGRRWVLVLIGRLILASRLVRRSIFVAVLQVALADLPPLRAT